MTRKVKCLVQKELVRLRKALNVVHNYVSCVDMGGDGYEALRALDRIEETVFGGERCPGAHQGCGRSDKNAL